MIGMAFIYLIISGIIFFIFITGLWAIYLLLSSRFFTKAPPVPTTGKTKQALLSAISIQLKEASHSLTVMDLGSGWGSLLIPLAKSFPEHQFIGIEKNYFPFIISRIRTRHLSNIRFKHQDLFKTNIQLADIIVMFLINHMMKRVSDKCQTELKKGTTIYSSRFSLPTLRNEALVKLNNFEKYYIYKI